MAAPAPSGLKRFYLVLAVVAVIGVGAMVFMSQRKTVSIPVNPSSSPRLTPPGSTGTSWAAPTRRSRSRCTPTTSARPAADFDAVQFPSVRERLIATGRVRWRYRDFPLDNLHPQARLAAHAAACANDQGKYWEMHRFIYEAQNDWAFKSDAVSQLRNLAQAARHRPGAVRRLHAEREIRGPHPGQPTTRAMKLGVPSTPTFVIGGRRVAAATSRMTH